MYWAGKTSRKLHLLEGGRTEDVRLRKHSVLKHKYPGSIEKMTAIDVRHRLHGIASAEYASWSYKMLLDGGFREQIDLHADSAIEHLHDKPSLTVAWKKHLKFESNSSIRGYSSPIVGGTPHPAKTPVVEDPAPACLITDKKDKTIKMLQAEQAPTPKPEKLNRVVDDFLRRKAMVQALQRGLGGSTKVGHNFMDHSSIDLNFDNLIKTCHMFDSSKHPQSTADQGFSRGSEQLRRPQGGGDDRAAGDGIVARRVVLDNPTDCTPEKSLFARSCGRFFIHCDVPVSTASSEEGVMHHIGLNFPSVPLPVRATHDCAKSVCFVCEQIVCICS